MQFQGFKDSQDTRVGNMTIFRSSFADKQRLFNGYWAFFARVLLTSVLQTQVFRAAQNSGK